MAHMSRGKSTDGGRGLQVICLVRSPSACSDLVSMHVAAMCIMPFCLQVLQHPVLRLLHLINAHVLTYPRALGVALARTMSRAS